MQGLASHTLGFASSCYAPIICVVINHSGMRFHLGPIPEEFAPNSDWQALNEPEPKLFVRRAIVYAGLPGFALTFTAWNLLGFRIGDIFRDLGFRRQAMVGLCFYVVLIVVHEAIHLCLHPKQAWSKNSVVGVMFKPFVFYAQYLGQLSRNRFLAVLLAPFLVLTVLPLLAAVFVGVPSSLGIWLALTSSVNALAACADLLGAALCFRQIPTDAVIRNNGWKTYWRKSVGNAL